MTVTNYGVCYTFNSADNEESLSLMTPGTYFKESFHPPPKKEINKKNIFIWYVCKNKLVGNDDIIIIIIIQRLLYSAFHRSPKALDHIMYILSLPVES